MERIAGIDLGTSTSCLVVIREGEPFVVPDGRGNRVTPSYIHVMEDGKILIGPQAKMEVISDPYSTIWATKRLIGRRYDDPVVQGCKKYFGYDILRAADGGVKVRGRDKELTPTEVGAIILKYLTRLSRKALGEEIKRVVITVPAYFTDPQRKATREAGTMIGLDVVRLVNEPTAAALAYGYDQDMEQTIAIFDLGGGTFDLSLLAIGQGVFEVMATDGDSFLGGEDFDNRLVDFLVKDFKKKHNINIYNDKMAHQRVKDAAERTKIALSEKEEVEINLPAICPDLDRWAGIETVISRKQYEAMVDDLVMRTVNIFVRLLKESGMTPRDLDNVVMVGGMTRMPLVRQRVADFLGYEPDCSLHPDEAVGIGAAIHAASLAGEPFLKKRKVVPLRPMPSPPPAPSPEPAHSPVSSDQELTRPAMGSPPGSLTKKPISTPPPSASGRIDYSSQPLPMEKGDKDLPVEPHRLQDFPPPPPAVASPTGEWTEEAEEPEVVEESEDRETEISAEPPLPPPPVVSSGEPSRLERPGEDDFFMPPAPSTGEAAPVQTEEPAATAPGVPPPAIAPPPAEEPVALEPEETAAPPPPLPIDPEALSAMITEEAKTEEVPGPFSEEDERPVASGPIIMDYTMAPPPTAEPPPPQKTPVPQPSALAEEPPAAQTEREYVAPPVLLDVLGQSVGIAHFGGHFVPIIKRFAKLPARASQVFTTCRDHQPRIRITVLQGEGKYTKQNTVLGEFVLTGIEKARRGVPEIEVVFDIDQSGIFLISARDKRTGAAREIRLEHLSGRAAGGGTEEGALDDHLPGQGN